MKILTTIFILFSLFTTTNLSAQTAYAIAGSPQVVIEGTSNVHDWDMKVETMSGGGAITWNADGSFSIATLIVKINCKAIKSSHGSIMDNKTYDALKAEKFPTITYRLTSPLNNIKLTAGGTTVNTTGEITIAGITKTITMPVTIAATANGQLSFQGSENLKMTDFGVAPPTAFMGAMKVGDNVVVKFKTGFMKTAVNVMQSSN